MTALDRGVRPDRDGAARRPLIALLLLLPRRDPFALGYVVGDWKALYFLAAADRGRSRRRRAAVGALGDRRPPDRVPGSAARRGGVYVREWLARRDSGYVDPWLI